MLPVNLGAGPTISFIFLYEETEARGGGWPCQGGSTDPVLAARADGPRAPEPPGLGRRGPCLPLHLLCPPPLPRPPGARPRRRTVCEDGASPEAQDASREALSRVEHLGGFLVKMVERRDHERASPRDYNETTADC